MPMLKSTQSARNVAVIIFMEELEKAGFTYHDFLAFCDGLHCEIAISPVHDKDEYTAEDVRKWIDRHIDPDHYSYISSDIEAVREVAPKVGDCKKSHVHVMIKYSGQNRGQYYSDLFAPILKIPATRWQKVLNVDSYLRYFAHMDSPEKYRYSELEIWGFGGIDMSALIKTDKARRSEVLFLIKQEIYKHDWRYFFQLDKWATSTNDGEIINYVAARSSYFSALFGSMRHYHIDKAKKAEETPNVP